MDEPSTEAITENKSDAIGCGKGAIGICGQNKIFGIVRIYDSDSILIVALP